MSRMEKNNGIRSREETEGQSAARMEYAKEILPIMEEIYEELGVKKYLGYIRIDGSTTTGDAIKESDIDFVSVAKGGTTSDERNALYSASAKIPKLLEEKIGSPLKFMIHIHHEQLE